MLTRRGLIEQCAAATVGSALLGSVRAAEGRALPESTIVRAFIVEAGSRDALAVGKAIAAHGIPLLAYDTDNDLAEIYCESLSPMWKDDGGTAVAGLTGATPLFYLERLAWADGLRVVSLGRHAPGPQAWTHSLSAPQPMLDAFHIGMRLSDWRAALARALVRTPNAAPPSPLTSVRDAVLAGDRALYSWVLTRPLQALRVAARSQRLRSRSPA
jgi:hypothetical protein